MAFRLPEPPPAAAPASREARIAQRTDVVCLKQMLAMGRQSYILLPSVFFIAYLALLEGATGWVAFWFVAWVARMVHVFRLVGRLRRSADTMAGESLRAAVRAYVFAGVVAGGLLPVFFARSGDMTLLIVTFLVTIYGNTMMIASSGVLRAGLAYGVPTLGVLIAGWLWHGGPLGYGLAAFLGLSFALSIAAIRAQRLALAEVVRVIDDNETLSAALAHERDRAESASTSKTRFFAAASHDLRQPLHALSINATTLDLVARRTGDALLRELSLGIGSALRQSRSLLDGLLDISKLDANAVEAHLAPHDVGGLLEAVHDEFAALAAQRGLSLQVLRDGADTFPLWVLTDADQLLRVLGNLVDNAIKFTREGGVTLSAHRGHDQVRVRVSDTGPGIAETEQERVFEEFYQVGNPSRDRSQGLGLGLAIVRRTTVLLKAALTLTSEDGRGTVFELSLPAAAAPRPGLAPQPPNDVGVGLSLAVLLVDDEAPVLDSLCTYLRQLGWLARGVAGGDDAERLMDSGFAPDVLVVDFRLRMETGAEVVARLRARFGPLPAVIVTGDTAAAQLRELSALGIDVLHKPVDGERLVRAMIVAAERHGGARSATGLNSKSQARFGAVLPPP
jgi:signal transduction histidine kinase/FixJ family two-component response regulator